MIPWLEPGTLSAGCRPIMHQSPRINALELATRIGFAARGLMYAAIAYLVLRLGRTEDNQGALAFIESAGGDVVLGIMAIGFVGYGVWRLSEAAIDTEGHGTGAKGIAVRVGGAVSGLIHLALAWFSIRLGAGRESAAGDSTAEGASTVMTLPGGPALLMIAAVALAGVGLYQLIKAVKLGFLKHLEAKAARQAWVAWAGRLGYLARSVVFVAIALFLWRAGTHLRAEEAGGIERALDTLPHWPRILVAIGLLLFGIFSLVEAIYRRIDQPDVIRRLERQARSHF